MRSINSGALRLVAGVLLAAMAATHAAYAQSGHEHHHHPASGAPAANATARMEIPPLRILMPEPGDVVGKQLALVFETPGNLKELTMSAPVIGVHLHIQCDDVALMPTIQQLIHLGKDRYLFLFDLPATPGVKTLRVYWSDAQHRTLESTIQTVRVKVAPE